MITELEEPDTVQLADEDPFLAFTEWGGHADDEAYAGL